jgi:hypothetical protein
MWCDGVSSKPTIIYVQTVAGLPGKAEAFNAQPGNPGKVHALCAPVKQACVRIGAHEGNPGIRPAVQVFDEKGAPIASGEYQHGISG